jgi:hypothetical protein
MRPIRCRPCTAPCTGRGRRAGLSAGMRPEADCHRACRSVAGQTTARPMDSSRTWPATRSVVLGKPGTDRLPVPGHSSTGRGLRTTYGFTPWPGMMVKPRRALQAWRLETITTGGRRFRNPCGFSAGELRSVRIALCPEQSPCDTRSRSTPAWISSTAGQSRLRRRVV